jgi:membrane protein DedA with SNARE-associated domain
LLFAGELVLLPAIYLAITGRLELAYVIAIAITATMLSDFGWYYVGRRFPAAALQRLPGRGTHGLVNGLDRLFDRRGAHVVFLSKFVYGTRAATQILAGVHDMPLRVYLLANVLGVTALTLVLSFLAWSVVGTARRYGDIVHNVEIAFVAFALVAAIAYFSAAMIARRRWSQ